MKPLPIDAVLNELVCTVRTQPNVVLQAPPGAGKTTRVPVTLFDAGVLQPNKILVLEPRRIAARAAAMRMSAERGTTPGDVIGWHVRFERKAHAQTAITCVTPGILLRYLHDDPFLEQYGAVLFDEFHERGLENDLAFGLLRLVQQNVRPDLRLIIMSATLDTASLATRLACPIVQSEGRTFPVAVHYALPAPNTSLPVAMANAIRHALAETMGDVLAFLPGVGEIRGTAEELDGTAALVLPLHGELPAEEQDAALRQYDRRKVVLATNVAETSVTVEGITAVVDSGLARQLLYDPSVGLDRLELVKVSQASAEQRAGRAGRLQPGTCWRLWSEVSHRSRPTHTAPEITRVDVTGPTLQLLALGENPRTFAWLDAPPTHVVEQALALLAKLGAVQDGKLTGLGATLARLPVHPRLARLLYEGLKRGHATRAALTAAMLSERSPFPRSAAPHTTPSDILDRVEVLENKHATSPFGPINRQSARFIQRTAEQLERSLRELHEHTKPGAPGLADVAILRALLTAFPDRVCRRREPGSPRGVMVGGRGVKLAPTSGVTEAEFFVAVDVDAGKDETLVRLASGIERDWLTNTTTTTAIEFDNATQRMNAVQRTLFIDLVLEEKPLHLPTTDPRMVEGLLQASRNHLAEVLPAPDSDAGKLLVRLRCLRTWLPELNLPTFDSTDCEELLTWLVPGCRTLADVRNANWEDALRSKLTHTQRQALDREAPERLEVPTGNKIAVQYEEGRPPVIAVRIQELFGLADTPRLAGGRVKVLLHLLAPNYRPQQVTDDLASFWANTYPVVRKELRGRYPKHSWPENPLEAEATSRPKRRGE